MNWLTASLLNEIRWGDLWIVLNAPASDVPQALRDLIDAKSLEAAEHAYDRLDNFIEVQGSIFSSAVACVPILVSALAAEALSEPAKENILQLLFMVSAGEDDREELDRGNQGVAEQANRQIDSGFWLYCSLLNDPSWVVRRLCLELVGNSSDKIARNAVLRSVADASPDPKTRRWAQTILDRQAKTSPYGG